MNKLVTIGVYGFNEESFFTALQRASVDTLCDIRRRRGVRGSEYAFANRARLEARLAALGIRYVHRLDLAPSKELRQGQYSVDAAEGVSKRQRVVLSPAFVEGYRHECLDAFDSQRFAADLGEDAHVVALLCVETAPAACHRLLAAERLAQDLGLEVEHLLPSIR
ncbi:MAG: hypothetical protein BroJett021_22930 [Chloroflexota bacterium]|nr:DUF488 domain-containing protein [Caldilinea sp.]GIK73305.1 MAG: hypothetical protein BroJett021_22930 [Chloroflexota bacterium]